MKANEFMSKIDKGEIEFNSVFASGTFGWEFDFAEAYAKHEINQLEAEKKESNTFIIDIAELLNIDADGIGFDGLTLSIDDFKEAINKLK